MLFSWAENQVLVCVKSVPLGQVAGQRLLLSLAPDLERAAAARASAGRRRHVELVARIIHAVDAARSAAWAALPFLKSENHHEFKSTAGRHRRPGRLRQDRLVRDAVQGHARPLRHGRHHQRHLHPRGHGDPAARQRAAGRAADGRRDRRLPAHRDPRGRLDQPRGDRAHAGRLPRPRPDPDRVGRRQPGRHLQSRAVGPDAVCDRRGRRREDPAQGRAGHHPLRPADHQQDRPGAARGRRPERDGAGCEAPARRAAVRVHQPAQRRGRRAR